MSCWALVPFKSLHLAKQRLVPVLPAQQRQRLAASMLQHVLDTLLQTGEIDQVALTSPQPCPPTEMAAVHWLADTVGELNAAVTQAVQQIWHMGATELIVLHSDLPDLCSEDLQALCTAGRASGLAIAPDRYARGTNALYLQRGRDWTFSFGPDSYQRHLQQATERGYSVAVVQRSGFAFDIDAPDELALWRASHAPHAPSCCVPTSRKLPWQPLQAQTV